MANARRWFDRSDFIETLDLRSELTMSGNVTPQPLVLSLSKDLHAKVILESKKPNTANMPNPETQKPNEPTPRGKTLRQPAQWTIAAPLVMSGDGPARISGEFLNRAGLRACVAGAYLALLGDHRAHAGTGLVAGALPR